MAHLARTTPKPPLARQLAVSLSAVALTGTLLAVTGPPAQAAGQPGKPATWGSTKAPNQVLKRGCASYRYRYVITPPTDQWAAELFLTGPGGKALAGPAFDAGANPPRGKAFFRLCAPSLRLGRYKIRMKITYQDGFDKFEGFVRPSTFRLTRR
ncbi:hypothetical protein [Nocardioides nanhaiensis]|uniref:Secreted protein n=1 Tax=Nocardioides nanhaiensis TaxID=1476871 RepID=A0ABP8WFV1_9ACTN